MAAPALAPAGDGDGAMTSRGPGVASSSTEGPAAPDAEAAATAAVGSASVAVAGAALPRRDGAITLEYVDAEDPALAGRPRLAADGTMIPSPRPRPGAGADPTRYGPDPTFPASYYAGGNAPTSVPRTREVWPGAGAPSSRPTLLSRIWRRFRTTDGTSTTAGPGAQAIAAAGPGAAPAPAPAPASAPGSAGGEPRDLAEGGQGVERVAADRLDEPSER
jgi:hypothetical protein